MNQRSVTPGRPPAGAPVFFWITIALLAMLLLGGAAAALLLVLEARNINKAGGWGWLLVGAIYLVAIIVVCSACALCTAVSLVRREPHRRLSIAILIISCLVVLAFGPNVIGAVSGLRRQHDQAPRTPPGTSRPRADSSPPATVSPTAENSVIARSISSP
jgi:hypothetical protein